MTPFDNDFVAKSFTFQKKCQEVLDEPEIRFCALISGSGRMLAGGFKNGVNPLLTENQQRTVIEELATRIQKRKKFDLELGQVKYSASRRENVVIMSFPIFENALMVVAEPHINIDRLSLKIINKIGQNWNQPLREELEN